MVSGVPCLVSKFFFPSLPSPSADEHGICYDSDHRQSEAGGLGSTIIPGMGLLLFLSIVRQPSLGSPEDNYGVSARAKRARKGPRSRKSSVYGRNRHRKRLIWGRCLVRNRLFLPTEYVGRTCVWPFFLLFYMIIIGFLTWSPSELGVLAVGTRRGREGSGDGGL